MARSTARLRPDDLGGRSLQCMSSFAAAGCFNRSVKTILRKNILRGPWPPADQHAYRHRKRISFFETGRTEFFGCTASQDDCETMAHFVAPVNTEPISAVCVCACVCVYVCVCVCVCVRVPARKQTRVAGVRVCACVHRTARESVNHTQTHPVPLQLYPTSPPPLQAPPLPEPSAPHTLR